MKVRELKKIIAELSDEADVPIRGGKCEVRHFCRQGTANDPHSLYFKNAEIAGKFNAAVVKLIAAVAKTRTASEQKIQLSRLGVLFGTMFEQTSPVIAVIPNGDGTSKR